MGNARLDFSILSDKGLTAIVCTCEDQAQFLIDEISRQHPHLVERWWPNRNHRWYLYETDSTYAPHIYDNESDTMQLASKLYWIENGYQVFSFESLIVSDTDLGDIAASDCDISNLFGLEIQNEG